MSNWNPNDPNSPGEYQPDQNAAGTPPPPPPPPSAPGTPPPNTPAPPPPAAGNYSPAPPAAGNYPSAPGAPGNYPGAPAGAYAMPKPGVNGMAIASLILAFLCSIAGLITGVIALNQIKRTGQSGRGLAIAGVVLSAAFIVIGLIVYLSSPK